MRKVGKEVVYYNYCCGSIVVSRKHFWNPDNAYYLAMKRMYMCKHFVRWLSLAVNIHPYNIMNIGSEETVSGVW